tara:strand:+ start:158 stop:325 length:168 start_codon:yes stop_codon:yes gene_type:complete
MNYLNYKHPKTPNNKKNQKELCLFEYKQDWKEIEHDIFGEYGRAKNMNIVFFIKE